MPIHPDTLPKQSMLDVKIFPEEKRAGLVITNLDNPDDTFVLKMQKHQVLKLMNMLQVGLERLLELEEHLKPFPLPLERLAREEREKLRNRGGGG